MKIEALRVREVGGFSEPVALEGLSGGLNVLLEDNEFGKSTLMSALKLVFSEKYSGTKQATIGALVPYSGGAPLIEVDFSISHARWRLTKQFRSQPSARLIDLSANNVVARGGDVETRLQDILHDGGRDKTPLNLFWLDQQAALLGAPIQRDDQLRLRDVVGREVATVVAEDTALPAVRAEIERQLQNLATGKVRKPRANGLWAQAIKDGDVATEAFAAAQLRQREAEERLQKLGAIDKRIAALTEPAAQKTRTQKFEAANLALQAISAAREKLKTAEAEHSALTSTLEIAENAKSDFKQKMSVLQTCKDNIKKCREELDQKRAVSTAVKSEFEAAQVRHASVVGQLSTARKLLDHVNQTQNQQRDQARHDELAETMQTISELRTRLEENQKALGDNRATATSIAALKNSVASIDKLEERLTASAPEVSMSYEASASVRIQVDGHEIEDGKTLYIDTPIVLNIPGIGALTISSGGSEDLQEDRRELAAYCGTRDDILHQIGVTEVAEAGALGETWQQLIDTSKEIETRLSVLAPRGVEVLCEELAVLSRQIGAHKEANEGLETIAPELQSKAQQDLPSTEEVSANVSILADQVVALEKEVELVRAKAQETGDTIARTDARLEELQSQRARLQDSFPEASEHVALLQKFQDKVKGCERAVGVALQNLVVVRDVAGDEERFQEVKRAFTKAEKSVRDVEGELAGLRLEKKGLEGELSAGEQHGIVSHLQECRERLERAEGRVKRIEDDVAALTMLADEMAAVELESRDRFLQPVLQGLRPYLEVLFPGAGLEFSEDLSMANITRENVTEPFAKVSDGTREQLAILARLGFGRVFYNAGRPLPLVLDDPFSFTDDERLDKMFSVLHEAAELHQVIVLSCRKQAFSRLGGRQLSLTPWQMDKTQNA